MSDLDPCWGTPSPFHDPYILAAFQARPTDVLITTAPKAGTTWMQQILHQLRSGGDDRFYSIFREVPWLELPHDELTLEQRLAAFDKLPEPRVFKTHCTREQTPGIGTARIILTTRDPRDCCVSFYHHLRDLTDAVKERSGIQIPETMEQHVEYWLRFGGWYRNVKSWWPLRDHPGVLMLRYEDLKTDLRAGLDRIIDFLGWSVSDEEMARVMEYCSFQWMKQNAARFTRQGHRDEEYFKPGGFIRRGVIGDFQLELSKEQELRILQRAREELEEACLEFLELV